MAILARLDLVSYRISQRLVPFRALPFADECLDCGQGQDKSVPISGSKKRFPGKPPSGFGKSVTPAYSLGCLLISVRFIRVNNDEKVVV